MDINYIKIIESLVLIAVFILLRYTSNKIIDKTMEIRLMQKPRDKLIKKAINLTLQIVFVIILLMLWGVNQEDMALYIGSVLTVVGVAFFAQWSILSNITSSIIIFFNHPVRLDDWVIIMEAKEYEVEGKVTNIGLFFVTLTTKHGEDITLPNNIFIQKMIKKKTE